MAGADVGAIRARMVMDASQFKRELDQAKAKLESTAKASRSIEAGLSRVQTAFLAAGAGVAFGIGKAVQVGMEFEAQISRVGAIAGATGADLERLEQTALDLGASTSKSATEVAVGMEQMAAAGFEVNEIIAAMPGVIAAAEASGEDMARVTEVVTAALNGFGLEASEASRVADIMAEAANRSAASIDDFGYAFKYAAPLAKQLGIEIEELSAMIMIMADAGLEGSQAGTTLRMALNRLASGSKPVTKALHEMGISMKDANGNFKTAPQLLAEVIEKMQDMDGQTRIAAASALFGTEAMSGMLEVIEAGPDKLEELTEALRNSEGASQEAAKKMKDNLKGSIEEMTGAAETAAITFYKELEPSLRAAVIAISDFIKQLQQDGTIQRWGENVAKLIDWLRNLNREAIGTTAKFAALASGALLVAKRFADLGDTVVGLAGSFGKLTGEGKGGKGGLSGLLSLIGMGGRGGLVGAILALAAAFVVTQEATIAEARAQERANQEMAEALPEIKSMYNEMKALQRQSNLTGEELVRYAEIQEELKRSTDPEEQKRLRAEMEALEKRSGLTREQLNRFVEISNTIAETLPGTTTEVDKFGRAFATSDESIRATVSNLEKLAGIDYESAISKFNTQLNETTTKWKNINAEVEKKQKRLEELHQKKAQINAQTEEENRKYTTQMGLVGGINMSKKTKLSLLDKEIAKEAESLMLSQKQKQQLIAQSGELQKQYNIMVNQALKKAGINAEGQKGYNILVNTLAKMKVERDLLQDKLNRTGKLTSEEQTRLNRLNSQISKLESQKRQLDSLNSKARTLNSILGKNIVKTVTVKTNYVQTATPGTKRRGGPTLHRGGIMPNLPTYHSGTDFAQTFDFGGIVDGLSAANARLLGGEMVLTRAQQARLFRWINEMNAAFSNLPRPDFSASEGGKIQVEVPVYLDGREIARAATEFIAEEYNARARRHQRSRGRR